jgi:uncharacterized protein YgbK (DUF1537 family)
VESYPEPTASRDFLAVVGLLPPVYPDDSLLAQINAMISRSHRKVVVLDDDPTGAQAMRDVFVLTDWSVRALADELEQPRPLFFVLTDTRSLPPREAVARQREVAANLREAGHLTGVEYSIMIRGDSTLRGHFPIEEESLGDEPILLILFFEEGGRFTIDDVQWVRERDHSGSELLIPAGRTPYARDITFGYTHSNLRNWVREKSAGRFAAGAIDSISVQTLRRDGPAAVADRLLYSRRQITIANATCYRDLEVLALGLLRAEEQGKQYIIRCAASFVRVRAGQGGAEEVEAIAEPAKTGQPMSKGGLFVIGSHVPKTSIQLQALLAEPTVEHIELSVPEVLERGTALVEATGQWLNSALAEGWHAVVYTSREVEPRGRLEGLKVGRIVSDALVDIVRSLNVQPRFIVAKGGWTSSAIAKQALGVRRAYAPRPVLSGVPMWILGPETRFPGMRYIIFPGNVGEENGLVSLLRL